MLHARGRPLAVCALLRGEIPPERMYQTVEVGAGIFAFIAPETTGPIPSGNVVAIVGDDGVLVVDSGRFPSLAKRMVADIRQKTDKPVRYLVHTHWHVDHIAGDGAFRAAFPDIVFVSTDFTRQKMLEKQVAYLRDVEKTNGGYVEYLRGILEKEKDLSLEGRRYVVQEVADIELEAAELGGGAARRAGPDVRPRAHGSPGRPRGPRRVSGQGQHRGGHGRLRSGRPSRRHGRPAGRAGALRLRLPPRRVDRNPEGADGDRRDDDRPGSWSRHARLGVREEDHRRARIDPRAGRRGRPSGRHPRGHAQARPPRRVEEAFAGKDYGRGKAFRDFFVASAVDRAYQEAKGAMAEE